MNKKEMIEQIVGVVKDILGSKHEVAYKEVKKNNGAEFKALALKEEGSDITLVIYIDQMVEAVAKGGKGSGRYSPGDCKEIYGTPGMWMGFKGIKFVCKGRYFKQGAL